MAKSATVSTRIEQGPKEQAEKILAALGIPALNAVTMFYRQIIMQKGLPLDVKLPVSYMIDTSTLTHEQMNAKLEKGYADIASGNTKDAKSVFSDIRRDYGV